MCRRGRLANSAAARNSSNVQPSCSSPSLGRGEPAVPHPLEVDEVGVVVDDHRRDAVGHALQVVGGGERLERVAVVAVAVLDPALVEQLEERSVQVGLADVDEAAAGDQEQVGDLLPTGERGHHRPGVGPGLDLDVGGLGALVVVVDHRLVGPHLFVRTPDPEGEDGRFGRGTTGTLVRFVGWLVVAAGESQRSDQAEGDQRDQCRRAQRSSFGQHSHLIRRMNRRLYRAVGRAPTEISGCSVVR